MAPRHGDTETIMTVSTMTAIGRTAVIEIDASGKRSRGERRLVRLALVAPRCFWAVSVAFKSSTYTLINFLFLLSFALLSLLEYRTWPVAAPFDDNHSNTIMKTTQKAYAAYYLSLSTGGTHITSLFF